MKKFFNLKHTDSESDNLLWKIFTYLDECDLLNVSRLNEVDADDKNTKQNQLTWTYWSMVARAMLALNLTGHNFRECRGMRLSGGMTNTTWKIHFFKGKSDAVLRVPGKGSSIFIDRVAEQVNAKIAERLGLNVRLPYSDSHGVQLSDYVTNPHTLSARLLENELVVSRVALMMRTLHYSSEKFYSNLDPFKVNEELIKGLNEKYFDFGVDIAPIVRELDQLKQLFSSYEITLRPCHNDPTPGNFLLSLADGQEPDSNTPLFQTDWEYSNMNDLMWDLAYFSELAKLTPKQQELLLSTYFGSQFEDEYMKQNIVSWFVVYKPILHWWVTLWSWMQLVNQADAVDKAEYEDWAISSFKSTQSYLQSSAYQNAVAFIREEQKNLGVVATRSF